MNEENKFGNFLKELRKEQKLSQEELGEKLYVHRTTINKWEKGIVIPLNDKLFQIASYFNVSVDELLNGKRSDPNENIKIETNIIKIFKTKSTTFKITLITTILIILVLILFLIYYFTQTYKSTEVYRFYGNNDNIKTKDGLILFSNDKMYFKPGNFYNNKNEIINIETIELYTYNNETKETLLKSDLDNLLIEQSNSHELFLKIIKYKENLYLDACYEKTCEQIKINSRKDYSSSKVIFDDIKTINEQKIRSLKVEPNLIDQLKNYGFKYDEESNTYYFNDNDSKIKYNEISKIINIIKVNEEYNYNIKIDLINKSIKYIILNKNNRVLESFTINDYTNTKDPNYNTFKEINEKYLTQYFQGFI